MTALPLTRPAGREQDRSLRPLPWRRMAWVTWRQHRTALAGVAAMLGGIAVLFWIVGVQLHDAFAAAIACQPGSIACGTLIDRFNGIGDFISNGLLLQTVPPLIGAFVGAPVLAREIESGTFRFAWTQGVGRWRWTLAKLVGLGVVTAAAAGALSILMYWYYLPYLSTSAQAMAISQRFPISPFAPGLFDLRGVTFAAWTLAAFAIGVLAGVLIRRVVPAIVATLVVYAALAFAAGAFLREHYVAPLVASSTSVPGSAWVISQQWIKGGRPVSQSVIDEVLNQGPAPVYGKGGVPKSFDAMQYLAQHGYTQLASYQPASRFWAFQWIEGGWLLGLSILLIAATVWVVRRRAN
jgi:hypothetical protein